MKKAKKKERALVRQAARDLGVEYHKGMGVRDLIRAESERIVRQAAASSGVDPDESKWRGLTTSRRDLSPIDQDKLIDIANYLAFQNPLGSRIHQVTRDFVIGEGVTIEAEEKNVIQPRLDEFWNDPVNNLDEFQFDLVDFLGINGELFLPSFVTPTTGQVQLGWLDPVEVQSVVPDRLNRRVMRTVVMKPGASAGYSAYYDLSVRNTYSIANVDVDPRSRTFGLRVGEAQVYRLNCAPDATRGRSDYEPIADMLDAHDQASFNALERAGLLLSFIWDVKLTGKSEPEIEKWLADQSAPKPGSLRAHNENVEWKEVSPKLEAADMADLTKLFRQIVLGSKGLSDIFFGISDQTNRAGSEGVELPIVKALTSRQRKIKAIFREICNYVIDQLLLTKPALRREVQAGRVSRAFEVSMPEISVKDLSKIGALLPQMTAALELAVARRWIKEGTAARAFATLIAQIGVEYDPSKEMEEAKEEATEAIDIGADDYGTGAGKKLTEGMATKLEAVA
ncbi:MAG: hypothetical protein AABN33_18345 [Acidobacteriota bacterium]